MSAGTVRGNTLLPPPRLSGNAQQDAQVIQKWMNDLYDRVVKGANLIGAEADLQARVSALEAAVKTLQGP